MKPGKDFTNILRTKVVAVTLDPNPIRIKNLQDKANEAADYIDEFLKKHDLLCTRPADPENECTCGTKRTVVTERKDEDG